MTAKEILQAALIAFGPEGEHWIKGYSQEEGKACAIHTCWRVSHPGPYNGEFIKATEILIKALPENSPRSTIGFNDSATTTFPDIKAWFERAINVQD